MTYEDLPRTIAVTYLPSEVKFVRVSSVRGEQEYKISLADGKFHSWRFSSKKRDWYKVNSKGAKPC